MAERLLASAMQMALDSDNIDGVVIDPWTSSATLDCSLLNGLLHASHDTDEPGEAELRAGTMPWPRNAGTTRCIIISSLPKRAAPRALP